MKSLRNIIISALIALTGVSCVSLDTPPHDRETDLTFWSKDPNAAIKSLNTCYTYIASIEEMMYSEAMTDNAYVKGSDKFSNNLANGQYSTADSYVKLVWDSRYTGIKLCNELLGNIDKVPGLSEENKKSYIGQALAIRAYHYYELFTKFGDVPYVTKVLSIAETRTISRTPKAQVVENILKDLDEVIDGKYLPVSYDADNKGRITHYAAVAIKAKICLFEGMWDEVRIATQDIMDNADYDLCDSYASVFESDNEYNKEVIMDVQYRQVSREQNMQYNFIPPSMGGYSFLSPLQELVDSYIMLNGKTVDEAGSDYDENKPYENRDPRLAATILCSGGSYIMPDGSENSIDCRNGRDLAQFLGGESDASATGYYIKKYWDRHYRATFMSGLNPIIIRYADILLMNAEALVELGKFDAAAWNRTIKRLRERAGFTDSAALNFPAGDMRSIVRNERRCELALEGHRHKDIMRWKIAEKVLNGNCHGFYTGEAFGTDNGYHIVENRKFNADRHYLWPIPQAERDLNKNLSQNPNW